MPSPEEMKEFFRRFGVDPDSLAEQGVIDDPFAGEVDLPVLVGRPDEMTTTSHVVGRKLGEPDYGGRNVTRKGKKTKKQSELLREFYALDPKDLEVLQERLFKAGFFGNVPRKSVAFGDHDGATAKAFETAVTRAALFNSAGRDITLDEMLDQAAERRKEVGESDPFVVHLTDARDVRRVAEGVSRAILGRKPTEADVAKVLQGFHAEQMEYARQNAAADLAGGTVTEAPTLESFAADALRSLHPTEAGAHEVAEHGNEFFKLLSEVSSYGA